MADDRLMEAIADLEKLLAAGINVVSSGPVFLQFPVGSRKDMAKGVQEAGEAGGASLYVNGIDPGFANDCAPAVLTSISERIDQVRCSEVLNYNTYNQRMIVFDVMGFGMPMDHVPMLLQPGILSMAWGSVVHQIAAGLGLELDSVEEFYERLPATETFDIDCGTIEEGTVAGLHFEVRGIVNGKQVVVLEHVTRVHDDIGPDWPQPAGLGCYRVEIKGEPNYTLDLQLLGTDGDHNTAGLKATAMRLVNAVPAVVAAKPGLVTALDLPLVTGKGWSSHEQAHRRLGDRLRRQARARPRSSTTPSSSSSESASATPRRSASTSARCAAAIPSASCAPTTSTRSSP